MFLNTVYPRNQLQSSSKRKQFSCLMLKLGVIFPSKDQLKSYFAKWSRKLDYKPELSVVISHIDKTNSRETNGAL